MLFSTDSVPFAWMRSVPPATAGGTDLRAFAVVIHAGARHAGIVPPWNTFFAGIVADLVVYADLKG